jgi:hypothetical protein
MQAGIERPPGLENAIGHTQQLSHHGAQDQQKKWKKKK